MPAHHACATPTPDYIKTSKLFHSFGGNEGGVGFRTVWYTQGCHKGVQNKQKKWGEIFFFFRLKIIEHSLDHTLS